MVRLNELISHCGDLTGRVAASLGISLQSEDNLCSEVLARDLLVSYVSMLLNNLNPFPKISHEIGRNFIQGLDTIVHTALKTAFERLEHIISNLNVLANDSFFGSMSVSQ